MTGEELISEKSSLDIPSTGSRSSDDIIKKKDPLTAVANGKKAKKSLGTRICEAFVGTDSKSLRSYLVSEVLIPSVKDTVSDLVKNGIDMFLYGERRYRSNNSRSGTKVSYDKYYDKAKTAVTNAKNASKGRFDFEDVCFDSRAKAQEVLDCMCDCIDTYRQVSVADMYDLSGEESSWQDNNWGWTNLSTATVVRDGNRFFLNLPKVKPL